MAWSFEPGVIVPLMITALLYRRGKTATSRERGFFWLGFAFLAIALISPIDKLGEQLFSAHMTQHEILMICAAPLFIASRPGVPLLFGLPLAMRRILGRIGKWLLWDTLKHPVSAWSIHAAAIWGWHAPALFNATLESEWIHAAQHLSFFGSALLFWWSILDGSKGAGLVSSFSTALHTSILGALLTFSRTLWYQPYAATVPRWGWTPIEDQQTGGLIMWVPAALVYVATGLILLYSILQTGEREYAQ